MLDPAKRAIVVVLCGKTDPGILSSLQDRYRGDFDEADHTGVVVLEKIAE